MTDVSLPRPGETSPLRVGVVGIGFGQHVHVPAIRRDRRASVAAICASTFPRARRVADALAVEHAFGDWRELCASPGVDVLAISVPAALQPAIVVEAARHGKHVFCEKPLACAEDDARAALDAVTEAGVSHGMDFEFRAIPHWRRARELCRSGELGRLRHVAITWRVETQAYRERRQTWKVRAADGGGTLNLFGSHVVDYVEWLFGRVSALAGRLEPRGESADARVDAWFQLESGVPVVASLSADSFCGSGHRVEVYGDEGTLVLENPTSDYVSGFRLSRATRPGGRLEEVMAPVGDDTDGRVGAVGAMITELLDRVSGAGVGAGLDFPTLVEGVRAQELSDQLRRASEAERWQR